MVTKASLDPRTAIRDAVRLFNKHVLNPAMLRLAGRPYWYAARLEHVGRRSGRRYSTPVVVSAAPGDCFFVPLPYGPQVDWLRNLQASGTGTLVEHGRRWTVSEPVVGTAADFGAELPSAERWRARVWRIGHWLRVKGVPADGVPAATAPTAGDVVPEPAG